MIDLNQPLDDNAPDAPAFLSGIQGNILKGHGRDYTVNFLCRLPTDATSFRQWLREFAAENITTAQDQREQTTAWRTTRGPGDPFTSLMISATGYQALGIDPAARPADPHFRLGMRFRDPASGLYELGGLRLNDPPVDRWQTDLQNGVDVMLLLADDDENRLAARVDTIGQTLTTIGASYSIEYGRKLTAAFGAARPRVEIEHFGHQDGISNPRLFASEIAEEKRRRGSKKWDPGAPLNLVLADDASGGHGSYMVFRKLEQNVAAFSAARTELATRLGISEEAASALAVGRAPDGTPAIATSTPDATADPNDFDFAEDRPAPAGTDLPRVCPFHAHIRKSNPRGDLPFYVPAQTQEAERSFRIARRGITYGTRPDLDADSSIPPPSNGVGLLFMCFQRRIVNFIIQQDGADFEGAFPVPRAGVDAVSGQRSAAAAVQIWPLTTTGDPRATTAFPMFDFVAMQGGEFLYAPSMAFFLTL